MRTNVRDVIRHERKRARLRAKDVAERMGISRPFYTQLENGTRRLTVDNAERAARALGLKLSSVVQMMELINQERELREKSSTRGG